MRRPLSILIVAATEVELAIVDAHEMERMGVRFTLLSAGGHSVGAVPTAVAMMRAAVCGDYNYAVNLGFCGARGMSLPIGSNVVVVFDTFFDYGFTREEGFMPLHRTVFPMQYCDAEGWLEATSSELLGYVPRDVPRLRGYTASYPSQGESLSAFGREFPAVAVETMEGAAFAYVARELRVPSIAIRTVSNYCAPWGDAQWDIAKAQQGVRDALAVSLRAIELHQQESHGRY